MLNHTNANWQHALDSLTKEFENAKDDSSRSELLIDMGYEQLGNYPKQALVKFQEALDLAQRIDDTALIVYSKLGIVDVYALVNNYNTAIELVFESLRLAKDDDELLSFCYTALGQLYYNMDDFEEARRQFDKSLKISRQLNDSTGIAIDLHNIGGYFLETDLYDSALIYFNESMKYDMSVNTANLSNLGHTYTYMGQYDSALFYHFEAYKIDSALGVWADLSIDEYYIAFTYFKKGDYIQALEYIKRSNINADTLKLSQYYVYNYELTYEIYEKLGDYKKAFEYAMLRNQYADSLEISTSETIRKILQAKHDYEEQQKYLQEANSRNKLLIRHKKLLVAFVIISISFLLGTFLVIYQKQLQYKHVQKLLNELALSNESKARIISILSHDLRGSIGNLKNILSLSFDDSLTNDELLQLIQGYYPVVDSTYDLLENLLVWARYTKDNFEPKLEEISLKSLVVKSIKHLDYIASSKHIEIVSNVEDEIITADKNMLMLVLRNLMSNAVKFSHPNSEIIIDATITKDLTEISVTDYGIGISNDKLENLFIRPTDFHTKGTQGERGSGLGLSLCHTFIKQHNGRIWAESEYGRGSSFNFAIPNAVTSMN